MNRTSKFLLLMCLPAFVLWQSWVSMQRSRREAARLASMARAGGWTTAIPGIHVALLLIPVVFLLMMWRWKCMKRKRAASASAAAAAAWRWNEIIQNKVRPRRHAWYIEARAEARGQICCACHGGVPRAPALVHACAACGASVHAACLRNAPKDCRSRAISSSPKCALHDFEECHRWCAPGEQAAEDLFQYQEDGTCCLVCHTRVAADGTPAAAAAPSWTCSGCRAEVHVACLKRMESASGPAIDQSWKICHFGQHRRLVMPPGRLRERDEKMSEGHRTKHSRSPWRRSRSKLPVDQRYVVLDCSANMQAEPQNRRSPVHDVGINPLLCFVSMASGALQGPVVLRRLMRILNPLQVVALPGEDGGPTPWLRLFQDVKGLQVLIAGGDGTVGWVMSCVDQLWPNPKTQPPIVVLPLGTGNDLSRCLGWGAGFDALQASAIDRILVEISRASPTLLDRWDISFSIRKSLVSQKAGKSSNRTRGTLKHLERRPRTRSLARELFIADGMEVIDRKVMNNYLGVGVDAKVTLDFHQMREAYPDYFQSQLGNKLWYTGVGARDILDRACAAVPDVVELEADGVKIDLPNDIEGILVLNIHNYMGGVQIWPDSAEDVGWQPSSMCDGMLEIVGVYGSFHLGQLQVGLSTARRIVQCSNLKLILSSELPVQIDGEPWLQSPCTIQISLKGQSTMLRRTNERRRGSLVEEILRDCEQRGIISPSQHEALTVEFSQGIQSSTHCTFEG